MSGLLALLPCAIAIVCVMSLKKTGVVAAGFALACTLALWASSIFSPASPGQLLHALTDSLVLELLVGSVIFCGLMFVEVSNRAGGLDSIGESVRSLHLTDAGALILITLGIGVTLESLTGYGVSMFVTIPLLLKVVSRKNAIALALIGMSLMSWGALSIASLLGAKLAGLALQDLTMAIVATSGPVALTLPALCVLLAHKATPADWGRAVLSGLALVAGIAATSHWIGIEIAGVCGGLAVIGVALLSAPQGRGLSRQLFTPALLPFGLLIAAVVVQKLLAPELAAAGISFNIHTERVRFEVLESPGIALSLVSLIGLAFRRNAKSAAPALGLLHHVAIRSWRALLSIFLFLLTARLLIEIGGITAIAQLLSQLGVYSAALVITLLGAFGAYATGSGVTSNALFMPSAAATGQNFDATLLFAALQHSGGAHAAMASLPILAILLAAFPDRNPGDEQTAMRTSLLLAGYALVLVLASGFSQLVVFY